MMRNRRQISLLAIPTAVLVLAGPALADTSQGVTVAVEHTAGDRAFAVETMAGQPLTRLDFGTGGTLPFRVRVTDDSFGGWLTSGFQVNAQMSNLYKTTTTGHAPATMIKSENVSVSYGATPISAIGVSLPLVPDINITGTIPGCADLLALLNANLPVGGVPLTPLDPAIAPLCTALGTAGTTVDTTVPGLEPTTLVPDLSNVSLLPSALSGAQPGPFTSPAFNGIGAIDTTSPRTTPPTTLSMLTGAKGALNATLNAQIAALLAAYENLPTTTLDDTGMVDPAALTAAIGGPVGNAISQLPTDAVRLEVLNLLDGTPVAPVLDSTNPLTGTYMSFPRLTVDASSAPETGLYEGTLTVTYIPTS